MKNIISIFLAIFLVSCNTKDLTFNINNLNDNEIVILGHRGMGKNYKYPGNTFESINTALNLGADGAEMDVQVTKDSVLVIYHNSDLSSLTNCQGRVIDFNWAELDSCKYATKDGEIYSVISVADLFSRISNPQQYYFSFDCKLNYGNIDTAAYLQKFVYAVKSVTDNYNMQNRILIETGSLELHQILKTESVKVLQFITGAGITGGIQIAIALDLYGIGIGSAISHKEVELIHNNGLRVMTWIPKSKWGNVKAVRKNPDFIQTAKLEHMLQILKQFEPGN